MISELFDILKEMEANFQANDHSNALMQLEKMTIEQLALLVFCARLLNNSLYQHLNSPQIQPFWEKKYNALRVKGLKEFRFLPTPNQSAQELFCGYVLFLSSLKFDDPRYYDLAIRGFNSFHALKHMSCVLIEKFEQTLENLQTSEELDESLIQPLLDFYNTYKDQLNTHKTPGSLCLANITVLLARFYNIIDHPVQAKFFLEASWYHLHKASLLEKYSSAEISNAYFGKGIGLSNHLNTDSISELKRACYHLSSEIDQILEIPQQNRIEINASQDARKDFPEMLGKVEEKGVEATPSTASTTPSPNRSHTLKKSPSIMIKALSVLSPVFKTRRPDKEEPKASASDVNNQPTFS